MATPYWSHRISQNPKSKAKSAGRRESLIQPSFELDRKIGLAIQHNYSKRSDILPRPFTTVGHQTKKPAELKTMKSTIKTGNTDDVYTAKKSNYIPLDSKNSVRFQLAARQDKSITEKHSVLTESILQRHNEYLRKNGHISMMDRVSAWVKSVPLFLDDPEKTDASESLLPESAIAFRRPKTTSPGRYQSPILSSLLDDMPKKGQLDSPSRHKSLPLLTDNTASPVFVNSWSSKEKLNLTRRIKELRGNAQSDAQKSIDTHKGKLLCCLKVEIKAGVYKMLPIHQNDDPAELSAEFCKAFRLVGSMESLKLHIQSSIKTYGK